MAKSFENKLEEFWAAQEQRQEASSPDQLQPTMSRVDYAKAKALFRRAPRKGELDLNEVKKSVYFFS